MPILVDSLLTSVSSFWVRLPRRRVSAGLRLAILLWCPAVCGCPYALAAKAALATAGGVVRVVSQPSPPQGGAPLPQDRTALFEAYRECLRLKTTTPTVDCSRYREAMQ